MPDTVAPFHRLNHEHTHAKLGAVSTGFGENATFQFYRTERWLGRIHAIYQGDYKQIGNFDDPLDYVLAFFLNCHHIKDWLKRGSGWRDDTEPAVKAAAVEQFVTESEALRICADLCNGNKHFCFDRHLRSGVPPAFGFIHTRVDLTTELPITRTSLTLRTARGETDAYELAQECIETWRAFIRQSTVASLQQLAGRNRAQRPQE